MQLRHEQLQYETSFLRFSPHIGFKAVDSESSSKPFGQGNQLANAAYVCEVVGAAGTNVNASLLGMLSKLNYLHSKAGTLVRLFISAFAHDAKGSRPDSQSDKGMDSG